MDAWIETYSVSKTLCSLLVAPYVGAWIETLIYIIYIDAYVVAPYVGAWIETMHLTLILPSAYSRTLCGCMKLSIEDHWGENESLSLSMSKWLGLMQQIFNENNELKDVDLVKLFDCWNS